MIEYRVRQIAEAQGFNVRLLAERTGLTYNTVHSLWRGHTSRIDLATLERVCEALNAQPGELLVWVKEARGRNIDEHGTA